MATYIVGDIQGCFDELQLLLEQVNFNPEQDVLWLAGDLVARGPKSLETLRFVKSLGSAAQVVLGNHDLHLLAISHGVHPIKAKDKTADIFSAPDKEALFHWLRQQPLLAEHDDFVMSHAGISPQWDLATARLASQEIATILASDQWTWLVENMYANTPDRWQSDLEGLPRYCYIINAFTRMRFCHLDARLDMACKLPPKEIGDEALVPWFALESRLPLSKKVLFGHWAALEGYEDGNVIGLDTGCVWGGELTMLRWEDQTYFKQAQVI
ncbi:bis(5'-nucleosyl)-tetraphosphatase (symmetrical) [Vibrio sp. 10N.286.49.B3]|uniref:bis(5'-nucleosyl)-tetraphosphatase (symmetrical) ApaH n=1 Tax=Vibrio sp. 10N.286.49.B3 TaxID=1880855 RepID=UPI000C85342D|nr:bis(5'-nucleosyl)-tetraphosphatase (symmetrical) ApaH [Vibrio sp. 10N.286.49.B3]PMH39860.1 bis(5'-nucleosyl)-tetraphosphatase (symmetrical) [Vibrio sp. 10N.286.49.B3]